MAVYNQAYEQMRDRLEITDLPSDKTNYMIIPTLSRYLQRASNGDIATGTSADYTIKCGRFYKALLYRYNDLM